MHYNNKKINDKIKSNEQDYNSFNIINLLMVIIFVSYILFIFILKIIDKMFNFNIYQRQF